MQEFLIPKKKVLFVTVPLRESPTDFPPIGILSMMSALRKGGKYSSELYNVDLLRPTIEEAAKYVVDYQPSVLAISAVVSTSFEWVRDFTYQVKSLSASLPIIVGGPLAASAEVVLKKTGVDFLCISEGEHIFPKFLDVLKDCVPTPELEEVPGFAYIKDGELFSTGYADPIPKEEIYELTYKDIGDDAEIKHYTAKVTESDPNFGDSINQSNVGKRAMHFPCSKGCVAKCTFCHRWDKGIRYIPVDILIARLKHYIEHYDVGFVRMSDENFGTDRAWLAEFCSKVGELGIVWAVSGMRVNCVSAEQLEQMKKAGCVRCIFGMETGSRKMLEVMNKGVKLEDNYKALDLMAQFNLSTTVQLVLGMPGEVNETVRETAAFVRHSVGLSSAKSPFDFSVNYAQALPGTPLYEYARSKGLVDGGVDGEERYLTWVSDKNAANEDFVIDRLSGQPRLRVLSWRPYLVAAAGSAYIEKFGRRKYEEVLLRENAFVAAPSKQGFFNSPKETSDQRSKSPQLANVRSFLKFPIRYSPSLFYRSTLALYIYVILREIRKAGLFHALALLSDFLKFQLFRENSEPGPSVNNIKSKSLRKIMSVVENQAPETSAVMKMLRAGRW
jgi:anaerobic magnesium-protoporphyrin IX monomethyl ester cyclase